MTGLVRLAHCSWGIHDREHGGDILLVKAEYHSANLAPLEPA
jgi:hypothetical protein